MEKESNNKKSGKRRWLVYFGCVLLILGLWHLVTSLYKEEEKALRTKFREGVKETFPEQSSKYLQSFGLSYYNAAQEIPSHAEAVILIHGLDDPGKVWQNLAPELVENGFHVWLMQYPNDQPIAESADLFFAELQQSAVEQPHIAQQGFQ